MQKLLASPLINVSLVALFWALQIFVAKLGFRAGAELFTFNIQSLLLIILFLSLYALPKTLLTFTKISVKTIIWLIMIGALGSAIGGTFSYIGIQLTTATNAGFLFQFDIALTILFAWLLLKEKLDLAKILMLIMILAGTFFLVTNGQLLVPHLGDIFILLAGACFAGATVLSRKLLKHTTIDPDVLSLIRPTAGLFVLLGVAAVVPLFPNAIQQSFTLHLLDFQQIVYVILNALFCVGTVVFLNRTLKIASASYTAMIASVTPILVAILGIAFLKETLTAIQLVGALFIIAASFVTHFLKVDKH